MNSIAYTLSFQASTSLGLVQDALLKTGLTKQEDLYYAGVSSTKFEIQVSPHKEIATAIVAHLDADDQALEILNSIETNLEARNCSFNWFSTKGEVVPGYPQPFDPFNL
jgi:hypothetical protein